MRRPHDHSRDLPAHNPRNPEILILQKLSAICEKRSNLLTEEAKLWSQASVALAEFVVSGASVKVAGDVVPSNRKGEPRDLLNVKEAATFLRLSPGTLNGWRLTGGGPEFVRLGRRIFYRASALEKFVQTRT